jgi:hypothetical protein
LSAEWCRIHGGGADLSQFGRFACRSFTPRGALTSAFTASFAPLATTLTPFPTGVRAVACAGWGHAIACDIVAWGLGWGFTGGSRVALRPLSPWGALRAALGAALCAFGAV